MSESTQRYGAIARFFHWAIAAMIVLQFILAKLSELAEHDGSQLRQLALLANHKSVGMTVLALAIARIGWRLLTQPPALPKAMPRWQTIASQISHWSLYGLLFALPITGWLMSSASAYSVSWFGVFTWPDVVAPDKDLRSVFHDLHHWLGKVLVVIALAHIAAALKHHFVDRDEVLKRMTGIASLTLFAAILGAGALTLTGAGGASEKSPAVVDETVESPPEPPVPEDTANELLPVKETTVDSLAGEVDAPPDNASSMSSDAAAAVSRPSAETVEPASTGSPPQTLPVEPPPLWIINQDASFIRFTAEQAGAEFIGEWQQWQADMRFSPDNLEDSGFAVRIQVAGVETNDDDRDQTLQDDEWFAAATYPEVTFDTRQIQKRGQGFTATADLVVKGQTYPIRFDFDVEPSATHTALTGSARLDRLALGVGTGEWVDTEWVGQFVDVTVQVIARTD